MSQDAAEIDFEPDPIDEILQSIVPLSPVLPQPGEDDAGHWTGHSKVEHRTTGGRAWCHECGEWCYPQEPCGQERCCAESESGRIFTQRGWLNPTAAEALRTELSTAQAELQYQRKAKLEVEEGASEQVNNLRDRAEVLERHYTDAVSQLAQLTNLREAATAWRATQAWDDPREYDEPERSLLTAIDATPPPGEDAANGKS